jgi:putative nucleotidyltransferase with HDIG domain
MSKMVTVEDLAPGDILADDVMAVNGRVLLGRGVALTTRHIILLNTWNVKGIFIESDEPDLPEVQEITENGSSDKNTLNAYAGFKKEYDSIVANVAQSFDIIQQNQIVPVSKMTENAKEIHSFIDNNFELLNHLLVTNNDVSHLIPEHSVMVAYFAGIIAQHLDWDIKENMEGVILAGLLHDIGSLIVNRPQVSSKDAHIAETARLLKLARGLNAEVILGIVQHREYVNGTGFPKHTRGPQIHPYAKIISIADSFHNLSYNAYGVNPFPGLDILKNSMYEKFDPTICQIFLNCIKDNLMLNRVLLSNNQEAEIIFFNKTDFKTPVVKTTDNQIIDLANQNDLKILRIVSS